MTKKIDKQEGLKSDYLELENFQGLGKVRVDIMGKSLLFIGKNDSGKSTLIRAMQSPMDASQRPTEPIKKGEETAKIIHKISGIVGGEHKEYIMELFFSQKDKKGRLVIKNEKGEILKAPATLIKSIIGNVSFDPRQWLNDTKAKKHETIKRLSGVGQKVDEINSKIKELKDARKYKSDRLESLRGAMDNHEFSPHEVNLYSNPIDMTPLQQEMSALGTAQNNWDNVNNRLTGFQNEVTVCNDTITAAEAEIARLQNIINVNNQKANTAKTNINIANDWLKSNQRPSVEHVNQKISEAIAHNEKHNRIGMLGQQHREMTKLIEEIENSKALIDKEEARKIDIISKSQLKIPGLTYTDEDLFIDGLPLDDKQINTARLWQIGVQVAKALNPVYKGIFLPDSSLFDKETITALIKEIEQDGYFGIFELVDFDGGALHVEFAETIL